MYITHNNQTYANVRVYSTSGSVRFTGDSLSGVTALTGPVGVFADNGFQMQTYTPGDFLRQDIRDGSWLLTNIPVPTPQPVVATPVAYDLLTSTANMTRILMRGEKPKTADEIIMCSALYDEWTPGKHVAGDIFSVGGDIWECFQNYDNAVNHDIVPGNAAWFTFNKPYHGAEFRTPNGRARRVQGRGMGRAGWKVHQSESGYSI